MFRIVILTLFTSALVRAQPAKTLPGGAVLKPERPVPVRPLNPPPDKSATDKSATDKSATDKSATDKSSTGAAEAPALPAALQPLAPLVGSFSGSTRAGAKVSAQCLAVAADTWIRCDVALDKAAALVAIGWDEHGKAFRVFVGDSSGKSALYKGRLKGQKLLLSGPERLTLDLTNPQQPLVSTASEVVTLARER
jgi:hypothetical protein